VELQHAMLRHLARKGVAVKRLVPAKNGRTYQEIDGQLVAVFEWFSGPAPDLRSARDVAQVAELHAKWTLAMADFDPPIPNWRTLAAQWRPRKGWTWVLPTEELTLVPQRMGFFAAVRDVEDPPPHHDRMLAQVCDTEARLARLADLAAHFGLSPLPRGLNHGVFLSGCIGWELTVTDADDFLYEARIGDLGRLLFAIHDGEMPEYETRDRVALALDVYREHVSLAAEELRALPIIAWGQFLHYDVFHILLYLCELDAPDRGEYLVAERTKQWVAIRDAWERRFLDLAEALADR
jgi:Ser/Thr protein kinase RdoA (MazF antagonist)